MTLLFVGWVERNIIKVKAKTKVQMELKFKNKQKTLIIVFLCFLVDSSTKFISICWFLLDF